MLSVKIIATGTLKEKYFCDAAAEYKKRLGAWCKPEEIIIKESRLPERPSEAQIKAALCEEGKQILKCITQRTYVVAMCVEGKEFSSWELAEMIRGASLGGCGEIAFIIGSSFGLSSEIKERADICFSVSRLTFPHQLLRVMLYEAVYRSFSIINNSKYHK